MRLTLKPISLRDANAYVDRHPEHHPIARGCKFCIGCYHGDLLVGVVIVERPKARNLDDGWTLELTRVCTARDPHVASKLIAAATRAAFSMGARRVLSYTLITEEGTSYLAAGWFRVEDGGGEPILFGGGEWSRPSRPRDEMVSPTCKKHRWERHNHVADKIEEVAEIEEDERVTLRNSGQSLDEVDERTDSCAVDRDDTAQRVIRVKLRERKVMTRKRAA